MGDMIGARIIDADLKYWTIVWVVTGYNGAGGLWVDETWNWKNGKTHHVQPRTLSYEESARLVQLGSLLREGPLQ